MADVLRPSVSPTIRAAGPVLRLAPGRDRVTAARKLGPMNLSPAFGVLGVLYAVFTITVAVLAVYALVLVIVFLRLRIAELKRRAPPRDDRLR